MGYRRSAHTSQYQVTTMALKLQRNINCMNLACWRTFCVHLHLVVHVYMYDRGRMEKNVLVICKFLICVVP